MSLEPVRLGIVGAGGNTVKMHIPGFREIPGVELVSVCNRSRVSSERVAAEHGIPRVYDHWRELVDAADTDAILVGTWPYLHAPVTLAALARGKHVLTEARMAMNAAEARAMLETSRRHPRLVCQVVPAPYTLSVDTTVRRHLDEGWLGRLLAVEVRAGGAFLRPDTPLGWRQDRELSGLNIMSLGIWYEIVQRWVGPASAVVAMGRVFVATRPDAEGREREVAVPEHLDVVAPMTCGAQAHFQISAVTGHAGEPEVWLFGSEATLCYRGGLWGGRRGEPGLREIPVPPAPRGGWRVEEEFVGAIRRQELVRYTTFEDGVGYMEFTEAVNRSLASGLPSPVAPLEGPA